MPRIDPHQLLNTLSVLLAPDGGIRSADDVPRIVQCMQKFSKKLVSKCIYIHVLRSSSPDLLEKFLSMKGWDLLNIWFVDALKTQNYYLCGDLVKLFALCPMNADRLAENPTINQAPKLIRQLSSDSRIEAEIRNLSLQVLQQWMTAARTPRVRPIAEVLPLKEHHNQEEEDDDCPVVRKKAKLAVNRPPKAAKQRPAVAAARTKKSRAAIESSDSSESEAEAEKVASKGSRGAVVSKVQEEKPAAATLVKKSVSPPPAPALAVPKARLMTANEIRKQLAESRSDESDVEDLLVTDSEEEEARKKADEIKLLTKPPVAAAAASASKRPAVSAAAPLKNGQLDRERERLQQRKDREQREKEKRRDRAKPYSRTELRKELETGQKDHIKNLVQKLKEENKGKSSLLAGLGRIPKLPKKEPANSFEALLGSMDSRPPPAKAAAPSLAKNKNKDLLESLAAGPAKPPCKASLEKAAAERGAATLVRLKGDDTVSVKSDSEEEAAKPPKEEIQRSPSPPKDIVMKEEDNEVPAVVKSEIIEEKVSEKKEKEAKKEESSSSSSSSSSEEEQEEDKKYEEQERRSSQSSVSSLEEETAVANKKKEEVLSKSETNDSRHKSSHDRKEKSDRKSSSSSRHHRHSEREKSRDKKSGEVTSRDGKAEKKDERRPSSDSKPPRPTLSLEKASESKRVEANSSSSSPKVKKSPNVIKESNIFGDVLSSIMKDDVAKKKKRRLSDIKLEKESKELAVKEKEKERSRGKEKHSTSKAEEEKKKPKKETEPADKPKGSHSALKSDDSMPFEEPKSALPREVKGILIFAHGTKSKKKLTWRQDDSLVEIEYFEMDETERANVWKQKTFEEKKKQEMMFEKMKLGQGQQAPEEEDRPPWSLVPLDYEHSVDYGKDSKEREEQRLREGRVLKALYFDNRLPTDPFEPDPLPRTTAEPAPPRAIPQIDLSSNSEESTSDFSTEGWPASSASGPTAVPPASLPPSKQPNLKDLLSTLKPSLIQDIIGLTSGSIPAVVASPPKTSSPPPQQIPVSDGFPDKSYNEAEEPPHNGYSRPPHGGHYPPPPHSAYPPPRGPPFPRGGGGIRPPHRSGPNPIHHHRPPYPYPPYRGGGGGGVSGPRPCRFWLEQGRCAKENRCNYAHVPL